MAEYRLFDPENPPEWLDPAYWTNTPNCDHWNHPAGVHKARMVAASKLAYDTAITNDLAEIVDIGAGDGRTLELIGRHTLADKHSGGALWGVPECTGYEIIKDSVEAASLLGCVWPANVTKEAAENLDTHFTRHVCKTTREDRLVIATEFFEHLADPHAMVRWLASRAEWVVASSPWIENDRRHEVNHAWAWDIEGYHNLLNVNGWDVVSHTKVEWSQIIVARRDGSL